MSSMQAPAPTSKAAKFKAANPLGPMVDPFQNLDDDQREYQKTLSENVNQRLEKTLKEIKERHDNGTAIPDDPDRAPTGEPYQREYQRQAALRRAQEEEERMLQEGEVLQLKSREAEMQRRADWRDRNSDDEDANDDEDDDDDEYDNLLDEVEDDPGLEAIREKRLAELKARQKEHVENMAKGHGQYRTISQDEFLPECTSSKWVAIHFYHDEFQRCKIMDHHLREAVAPKHTECKFLRVNAEKAPFFVAKLKVKALPTLLVFHDGELVDRLIGFQGLVEPNDPKPDEWKTENLQAWLAGTGAIDYVPPHVSLDELEVGIGRMGLANRLRGRPVYGRHIRFDENE